MCLFFKWQAIIFLLLIFMEYQRGAEGYLKVPNYVFVGNY
jgi:hypothetical protein